jgi:hypothetical protein
MLDRLPQSLVVALIPAGALQPERIDDPVKHLVAQLFGNVRGLEQQLPSVRIDRFVAFDPAESCIFVSGIAKEYGSYFGSTSRNQNGPDATHLKD